MLLMADDGVVAVALIRTKTVVAAFPIALLGMLVPLTDVQVSPLLRLNSIAFDTPVIAFWAALSAAFGAAARTGTVTVCDAETNAVSVALKRTW
jgi:hypothetical protein